MTSRWRAAERRRLLAASERIARRRVWWIAQRDAAAARVDAIAVELAIVNDQVDALEAGSPEPHR